MWPFLSVLSAPARARYVNQDLSLSKVYCVFVQFFLSKGGETTAGSTRRQDLHGFGPQRVVVPPVVLLGLLGLALALLGLLLALVAHVGGVPDDAQREDDHEDDADDRSPDQHPPQSFDVRLGVAVEGNADFVADLLDLLAGS